MNHDDWLVYIVSPGIAAASAVLVAYLTSRTRRIASVDINTLRDELVDAQHAWRDLEGRVQRLEWHNQENP